MPGIFRNCPVIVLDGTPAPTPPRAQRASRRPADRSQQVRPGRSATAAALGVMPAAGPVARVSSISCSVIPSRPRTAQAPAPATTACDAPSDRSPGPTRSGREVAQVVVDAQREPHPFDARACAATRPGWHKRSPAIRDPNHDRVTLDVQQPLEHQPRRRSSTPTQQPNRPRRLDLDADLHASSLRMWMSTRNERLARSSRSPFPARRLCAACLRARCKRTISTVAAPADAGGNAPPPGARRQRGAAIEAGRGGSASYQRHRRR